MIPGLRPYLFSAAVWDEGQRADLKVFQQGINRVLDEITNNRRPQLSSELLASVDLVTGSNLVAHKLDRAVTGWMIVDRTGAATVYRDTTTSYDTRRFLGLVASADVTVRLLVF